MSAMREIDVVAAQLGQPLDRNIYCDDMPVALEGSVVTQALIDHLQRMDPFRLVFSKVAAEDLPYTDVQTLLEEAVRPNAAALVESAGIAPDLPEEVRAQGAHRLAEVFDSCRYLAKLDLDAIASVAGQLVRHLRPLGDCAFKLHDLRDHDAYTYFHSINVCVLGLSLFADFAHSDEQLRELGAALLLHDIGKSKVDQRILLKPHKLGDEEEQAVARHVVYGYNLVRNHPGLSPRAKAVVLNHHERCDGSGYLRGLREAELSDWDLLAAVVDVFDEMTTSRYYRQRLDQHRAIGVLVRTSGTLFSSRIVNHFLRGFGRFPVGTFVELSNGELAVVSKTNPAALALPQVRVLFANNGERLHHPRQIDLLRDRPGLFIDRALDLHAPQSVEAARAA
jgi:HD-GYP domain-containing protein (c-di-GMP phosphodiesterase class II)